jgi:hypothetical protein
MNAERWASVKSLFLEIAALPAAEQQAFLRDLERADSEIATLLEELMEEPATAGLDLQHPCWAPSPEPSSPHMLEPGQVLLNRFEIVEFIGSGGLGEVYRAREYEQKAGLALKTARMALAAEQSAMASLRNEVNMARLVTHPHVCRIHDFHWDPARSLPFVTMELVQGETLAQRLRRDGRLSHEAATPIVDRMLSALEAAHSNGVIHRDLKPANVMLTDLGQVKVMDFGLAREVHRGRDLKSTLLTNALAGTPAYMAPEQLRGETATIASDIHSMGVVLFEVVTGRRPFEGATPLEIASRRLHEDPPPPRKYISRVDRRWNYTIVRCLEREPSRRPTSVAEVRRCLVQRPPISRRTWIGGLAATISVGGAATFLQLRKNSAVIEVFDIENRTHDAALDYLCKGTTSELMRRLAQVASLRVIAAHAARSQSAPHGGGFALYGVAQDGRRIDRAQGPVGRHLGEPCSVARGIRPQAPGQSARSAGGDCGRGGDQTPPDRQDITAHHAGIGRGPGYARFAHHQHRGVRP